MLLDIKGIYVHYGTLDVVSNVSMQIPKGSIVSLLGANASGKSTIMRCISGLKRITSGEIWYGTTRIDRDCTPQGIVKLGIAQVPEGRGIFPYMSVAENLRMGAFSRRDHKEVKLDIERLFDQFPILKERRNKEARLLSGGQQQILAIARALLEKPSLLLLDEPLQGMAPSVQQQIADIVLDLNKRGITILMVEHNLHMALEISHHVYILDMGKLILKGKPEDLSKTEYVKNIYLAAA